jgi:hypothetical protein
MSSGDRLPRVIGHAVGRMLVDRVQTDRHNLEQPNKILGNSASVP